MFSINHSKGLILLVSKEGVMVGVGLQMGYFGLGKMLGLGIMIQQSAAVFSFGLECIIGTRWSVEGCKYLGLTL